MNVCVCSYLQPILTANIPDGRTTGTVELVGNMVKSYGVRFCHISIRFEHFEKSLNALWNRKNHSRNFLVISLGTAFNCLAKAKRRARKKGRIKKHSGMTFCQNNLVITGLFAPHFRAD